MSLSTCTTQNHCNYSRTSTHFPLAKYKQMKASFRAFVTPLSLSTSTRYRFPASLHNNFLLHCIAGQHFRCDMYSPRRQRYYSEKNVRANSKKDRHALGITALSPRTVVPTRFVVPNIVQSPGRILRRGFDFVRLEPNSMPQPPHLKGRSPDIPTYLLPRWLCFLLLLFHGSARNGKLKMTFKKRFCLWPCFGLSVSFVNGRVCVVLT